MLHEVVVPAGMRWRAALRRRDHVALAITVVHDRRRTHLACLCPTRRKEQKVVAPGPDPSSALRVAGFEPATLGLGSRFDVFSLPFAIVRRRSKSALILSFLTFQVFAVVRPGTPPFAR